VIDEMTVPARAEISMVCIDAGRRIDSNDEQSEKVRASIRFSFESDSQVNDDSDVQPENEPSPRNTTDAGRQIDFSDEQL
jgi:hypothetical protein